MNAEENYSPKPESAHPNLDAKRHSLRNSPKAPEQHKKLSKESVEEILSSREVVDLNKLKGGTNKNFKVKLHNDGEAIFKPQYGEKFNLLWLSLNTYKRERASYLTDRFFGFNLVPETIIRKIDGKVGSVQKFIHNAEFFYNLKAKGIEEKLYKLWIFDYITYNQDRHKVNLLRRENNIYAVDHELTFFDSEYSPFETYFGKQAPKNIVRLLENFLQDDTRLKKLEENLVQLVSKREVDACMARIKYIGKTLVEREKVPVSESKNLVFFPNENRPEIIKFWRRLWKK